MVMCVVTVEGNLSENVLCSQTARHLDGQLVSFRVSLFVLIPYLEYHGRRSHNVYLITMLEFEPRVSLTSGKSLPIEPRPCPKAVVLVKCFSYRLIVTASVVPSLND